MNDIGNIDHLAKVVDSTDFPEELIINYYPSSLKLLFGRTPSTGLQRMFILRICINNLLGFKGCSTMICTTAFYITQALFFYTILKTRRLRSYSNFLNSSLKAATLLSTSPLYTAEPATITLAPASNGIFTLSIFIPPST